MHLPSLLDACYGPTYNQMLVRNNKDIIHVLIFSVRATWGVISKNFQTKKKSVSQDITCSKL